MSELVGDPDSSQFWQALNEGRLLIRSCESCGPVSSLGQGLCTLCSRLTSWVSSDGTGSVYAYTEVTAIAAPPKYRDRAPYMVALIDLTEGVRVMGQIVGSDLLDLAIGKAVTFTVIRDPDQRAQLAFRLTPHKGAISEV